MPGGRPPKTAEPQTIIQFAAKGLTTQKIAALCNMGDSTLRAKYQAELEKGRILRNSTLQERQFEVALNGAHSKEHANPTMLIWLGKQWLGQTDKSETQVTGQILHGHVDLTKLSESALRELASAAEDSEGGDIQRALPS